MRQAGFMALAVAVIVLSSCAGGSVDRAKSSIGFGTPKAASSTVSGGLVSQTGVELSRSELASAIAAEQRALESGQAGQPINWQGSEPGRGGAVIAAQPYRVGSQDCRPYSHVVNVGGPARSVRGTACRNPDGSWVLLN